MAIYNDNDDNDYSNNNYYYQYFCVLFQNSIDA